MSNTTVNLSHAQIEDEIIFYLEHTDEYRWTTDAPLTAKGISALCPNIAPVEISKALKRMMAADEIIRVGHLYTLTAEDRSCVDKFISICAQILASITTVIFVALRKASGCNTHSSVVFPCVPLQPCASCPAAIQGCNP